MHKTRSDVDRILSSETCIKNGEKITHGRTLHASNNGLFRKKKNKKRPVKGRDTHHHLLLQK